MKQWELAKLVNCSVETIRKVEKGRIGLSEALARRISVATGVDADWLVKNDLDAPPVTRFAPRYDELFFHTWRGVYNEPLPPDLAEHIPDYLLCVYIKMRSVVTAAAVKGERYALHALAEVQRPVAQLAEEFGLTDEVSAPLQITASELETVERDVVNARNHIEDTYPIFRPDGIYGRSSAKDTPKK